MSRFLPNIATQPDYFRLRWRFQFKSKPDRVGVWNEESNHPSDGASAVVKLGLTRAIIEGENCRTFEIVRFVYCPGQDYIATKVEAYARIPGAIGMKVPVMTKHPVIYALCFLTRYHYIAVSITGRIGMREPTPDELRASLREHRIGD